MAVNKIYKYLLRPYRFSTFIADYKPIDIKNSNIKNFRYFNIIPIYMRDI